MAVSFGLKFSLKIMATLKWDAFEISRQAEFGELRATSLKKTCLKENTKH